MTPNEILARQYGWRGPSCSFGANPIQFSCYGGLLVRTLEPSVEHVRPDPDIIVCGGFVVVSVPVASEYAVEANSHSSVAFLQTFGVPR